MTNHRNICQFGVVVICADLFTISLLLLLVRLGGQWLVVRVNGQGWGYFSPHVVVCSQLGEVVKLGGQVVRWLGA